MNTQKLLPMTIHEYESLESQISFVINTHEPQNSLKNVVMHNLDFFDDWLINDIDEGIKTDRNYLKAVWLHSEFRHEVRSILEDAENRYTDAVHTRLEESSKYKVLLNRLLSSLKNLQVILNDIELDKR